MTSIANHTQTPLDRALATLAAHTAEHAGQLGGDQLRAALYASVRAARPDLTIPEASTEAARLIDQARAEQPSPLEQIEDAHQRRDAAALIDAAHAGQQSLESAPWYPARAGDLLHIHYAAVADVNAFGETYIVENSPEHGGHVLRLIAHTAEDDGIAGFYAPGITNDPFFEAWFEVRPSSLTIVRDGRVVHGGA